MATETFTRRGRARWYPRWAGRAMAGVGALVALALVAVEVVWPLSAGLPLGWGQYQNSAFHLHIGTPAFWSVTDLNEGAATDCLLNVVASPSPARSAMEAGLMPRWMAITAVAPCDSAAIDLQPSLWQPTGQSVDIAGQSASIERDTGGPSEATYRASVTLHGYTYLFMLHDLSAAQAQRDLPDFLTFMRSFRYVS